MPVGPAQASPEQVVVTFADVTAARTQEANLQRLNERLELAVRAVRFGVWDWNLKQGTLAWDPFMYELFEINPTDFSGDYDAFSRTLIPEDAARVQQELQAVFEAKSPEFRGEFRVQTALGTTKIIAAQARCMYDAEGKIDRLVGFNWDVTDQRRAEAERRATEAALVQGSKMASLGEMASGVAHEINTPLTVIQGKAFQMLRALDGTPFGPQQQRDTLQRIIDTTERIARIIRGLKSFSRSGERDPFLPCSLRAMVRETLDLCEERMRHNGVELRLAEILDLHVNGRASQLSQVLLNLLGNAYDAVQSLPERWISVECRQGRKGRVELRVTDSGTGIPDAVAERMMQPFFTTKELGKGTGLGLSISKGIIEEHGGTLRLDRQSKNTCFVIELPVQEGSSS